MTQIIKCYNENDNLVTFAEVETSFDIIKFYNIKNKTFTKFIKTKYKKRVETLETAILFSEECELMDFVLDGEHFCRVKKMTCNTLIPPPIISKFSILNDSFFENYTIRQELIKDWLKKI